METSRARLLEVLQFAESVHIQRERSRGAGRSSIGKSGRHGGFFLDRKQAVTQRRSADYRTMSRIPA